MKSYKLVLLIALVLQFTSANGFFSWWNTSSKKLAQAKDKAVNLSDSVRSFQMENFGLHIPVGTTYHFKVPENPTTGYTWNIKDEVKEDFEKYFTVTKTFIRSSDEACENCTGAGGMAVFEITAVNPGTANFQIEEKRPWENDIEPMDSRNIQITVEE